MILIAKEIAELDLVQGSASVGRRDTTYDATVGEIIREGETFKGDEYVLPSRGMVWVVSHERFALPRNLTGLATLRTTWTHNGILALNVGIIDPGWDGPLATALVNFGNGIFTIKKGDPFLRVVFLQHITTESKEKRTETDAYLRLILDRSAKIPSTFLNLSSLAEEMWRKLFASSMFGNTVARYAFWFAVPVAVLSIFIPIAYGVSTEFMSRKADVNNLKTSVEQLQKVQEEQTSRQVELQNLKMSVEIVQKGLAESVSRQQILEEVWLKSRAIEERQSK